MPGIVQGEYSSLLGVILGADMNSTADQEFKISAPRYIIRRIAVVNATANLTLAAGGIYTAAAKGGTAIVTAVQIYTALSAGAKFLDLTLAAVLGTDILTESSLYLSLTTAQGSAALADFYLIGDRFIN
jgi:hypothetical protein